MARRRVGAAPTTGRPLKQRVKTARGRKVGSTRWLERQLNDPYVLAARREGYRSRAAYKFIELERRFSLIKRGAWVVDLGAAPGGWTQVAVKRSGATADRPWVVAVDILEVGPIAGSIMVCADFTEPSASEQVRAVIDGPVGLVMSDMAAPTTGHKATDHIRIVDLCERAYQFAGQVLAPGGHFLAKVLKGGAEGALLLRLKRDFRVVRHVKPAASRKESAESYVVACFYRGADGSSREKS